MTDIEHRLVESWKEHWHGVETYYNMLIYASFIFVGVGIGTIAVTNRTLVDMQGNAPQGTSDYPPFVIDAMAANVQEILIVAMAGFVACHVGAILISSKFG